MMFGDGPWYPRLIYTFTELCPAPSHAPFSHPPSLSNQGTTATYRCIHGYQVVGGNGATSTSIQCVTSTRNWGSIPTCEREKWFHLRHHNFVPNNEWKSRFAARPTQVCGAPPAVNNAMSQVSGNKATYTCNAGYVRKVNTPSTIICSGTTWMASTLPACGKYRVGTYGT